MIKINLDDPLSYKDYIGRWNSECDFYKPVEIDYVHGMHCTKILNKNEIVENGLKLLKIDERIEYVKNNLLKTNADNLIIKCFLETLSDYYDEVDKESRENQVCFVLNRSVVFNESGCEDLFKYYGGECIYRAFQFKKNCAIEKKLTEIGLPVIIQAWIPYKSIIDFQRRNIIDFINGESNNGCEAFSNVAITPDLIQEIEYVNICELPDSYDSSFNNYPCDHIYCRN